MHQRVCRLKIGEMKVPNLNHRLAAKELANIGNNYYIKETSLNNPQDYAQRAHVPALLQRACLYSFRSPHALDLSWFVHPINLHKMRDRTRALGSITFLAFATCGSSLYPPESLIKNSEFCLTRG
ncbi:uncharacterized protein PgNI_00047 [Pyricularia grisea]|uniref:Uncharacterized protein n=1 Tax=Pyricularia grisea TaxID=148305 RepID=A0A6P8BKD8_PYRGI|nr:uncharacterized protein PgNI_00047 [Pyricularia grisea]TLD17366.1 hypothetical protein PgNI_00047 [Pyricularia grisea]